MIQSCIKNKIHYIKSNYSKKQAFLDDILSEYIGKPKELWETLKSLSMPKKTLISNFNGVESNNALTFDKKTTAKFFQDFFSNLYYSKFIIEKPLHLGDTSEDEVFKIIQNIDISKAASIDNLSGKFLKDGDEILAKPYVKFAICQLPLELF